MRGGSQLEVTGAADRCHLESFHWGPLTLWAAGPSPGMSSADPRQGSLCPQPPGASQLFPQGAWQSPRLPVPGCACNQGKGFPAEGRLREAVGGAEVPGPLSESEVSAECPPMAPTAATPHFHSPPTPRQTSKAVALGGPGRPSGLSCRCGPDSPPSPTSPAPRPWTGGRTWCPSSTPRCPSTACGS